MLIKLHIFRVTISGGKEWQNYISRYEFELIETRIFKKFDVKFLGYQTF